MTTLRTPTEHDEQVALIATARRYEARYPDLGMLFAVPNGGYRSKATGNLLKLEGLKPGVSDLLLLVPRGSWHGMCLELKRVGGEGPSPAQEAFLMAAHKRGYYVAVAYGWAEAWREITGYLGIPYEVM